ncbi:hypothetical protein BX600DRAFT_510621 [Xylariales sp. PMI_506]|nr:hypothetical protein BX600DRAFT_510621 [Xylariales sp. PMI_506]
MGSSAFWLASPFTQVAATTVYIRPVDARQTYGPLLKAPLPTRSFDSGAEKNPATYWLMTSSLRRLLPKYDGNEPLDTATTTTKRRVIPLACQRCRSKKINCGGERPDCSPCRAKGVNCQWDDDPETTPRANLKRECLRLEDRQKDLMELYTMLKYRPEAEAISILQRVRATSDVHTLLESIRETDLMTLLDEPEMPYLPPWQDNPAAVALPDIHWPQFSPPLSTMDEQDPESGAY